MKLTDKLIDYYVGKVNLKWIALTRVKKMFSLIEKKVRIKIKKI